MHGSIPLRFSLFVCLFIYLFFVFKPDHALLLFFLARAFSCLPLRVAQSAQCLRFPQIKRSLMAAALGTRSFRQKRLRLSVLLPSSTPNPSWLDSTRAHPPSLPPTPCVLTARPLLGYAKATGYQNEVWGGMPTRLLPANTEPKKWRLPGGVPTQLSAKKKKEWKKTSRVLQPFTLRRCAPRGAHGRARRILGGKKEKKMGGATKNKERSRLPSASNTPD